MRTRTLLWLALQLSCFASAVAAAAAGGDDAVASSISVVPQDTQSALASRSTESQDDLITSPASIFAPDNLSPATALSSPASITATSQQRNLIIILTTTLGTLSLLAFGFILYIIMVYRRGQRLNLPFWEAARTITPIDDDEIASWRKTYASDSSSMEKLNFFSPHCTPSSSATRLRGLSTSTITIKTMPLAPINTHSLHRPSLSPPSPTTSPSIHSSPFTLPTTPAPAQLLAQAPNARAGLTDDIVPGEPSFIAIAAAASPSRPRRPSFKVVGGGGSPSSSSWTLTSHHRREKSGRSSLSTRSVWSLRSAYTVAAGAGAGTEGEKEEQVPRRRGEWYGQGQQQQRHQQHGFEDAGCDGSDVPMPMPMPMPMPSPLARTGRAESMATVWR